MVIDMNAQPIWRVAPVFAPITPAMIEGRQLPSFNGWQIAGNDDVVVILETDDAEAVKDKLLELASGSPHNEVFSLAVPTMPETDDDWESAVFMLALIAAKASDRPYNLPLPYFCTIEIDLERIAMILTETIHDEIPGYDDPEDFREDDFDNHTYTPLREALMEVLQ